MVEDVLLVPDMEESDLEESKKSDEVKEREVLGCYECYV